MGRGGRFFRYFGAAALVATVGVGGQQAPAGAISPLAVEGFVRDRFGTALAGATVVHGGKSTTTDASGYYSLPKASNSAWVLAKAPATDRVDQKLGAGQRRMDFALPYHIEYVIGREFGANGTERAVRAFAEPPEGRCVDLVDEAAGHRIAMSRRSRDLNPTWFRGDFVPSERADGRYPLTIQVTDCETHSVDGGRVRGGFAVDSTPPVVEFQSSRWLSSTEPEIVFTVADALAGYSTSRVYAYLDGAPHEITWDGSTGRVKPAELSPGVHSVVVTATDRVENQGNTGFTFRLDTTPPQVVNSGPEGEIADRAPVLWAKLKDPGGAGVDPLRARMRLSDGTRSRELPFAYDAETRVMSYDVPDAPVGDDLGDGPLAPGPYSVTVIVPDKAGNTVESTTAFTVR